MNNKDIKELIELTVKEDIKKLKVVKGDFEIEIDRNQPNTVISPMAQHQLTDTLIHTSTNTNDKQKEELDKNNTKNIETLNAPMVGSFYSSSKPGAAAFVEIGAQVKKGSTVAIIEAMKIMNDIEAEFDFKVLKVLLEDGSPVEYGTPIFEIERV